MKVKALEVNVDDYLHGGVYQLVTDWVRTFPEDIKIDIAELEPFEDERHIEDLKRQGCDVYYVGSDCNKIKKQIAIYKNVRALIEKEKYDVVHLHSDVAHKILISGLAAKKCGVKKIIFHSHANDVEGGHKKLRVLFHKFCAGLLKNIKAIHIATSEDAAKWMFPGVSDVIILNNGVDYKKYFYDAGIREKIRKEHKLEDKFVIGFIGRFVDQKNPFYLLSVLRETLKEIPDAVLMCIGQGRLAQEFTEKADADGNSDHILMLGGVDNAPEFYQAMDVMIMPSNFEGFGLVAVEAQVSGTYIIASDKVPEMTRISDRIEYLPIGDENVHTWAEAIKKNMDQGKKDMSSDIDYTYDIGKMTDELVRIYKN